MNAFDPIAFAHRLEGTGFERAQAETLASEMRGAMQEHVTREQLDAALDRLVIRLGGVIFAVVGLATGIILAVLS